jgi:hypothetical protein
MNRATKVAFALALTSVCVSAHGPECHPAARGARVAMASGPASGSATVRDYEVMGITDPMNLQTVELTYSLPAGVRGRGAFQISVDNAAVELAKIELVAIDSKLKLASCSY